MKVAALARYLGVALLGAACTCAQSEPRTMNPTHKFFSSGPQAQLEIAIRADDPPAIGRALAAGAKVNATGQLNVTPLMIAVDAQCPRAVRTLLDDGAAPNRKALDGNGAVSLAVRSYLAKPYGRDILLAILEGGGDPDTRQPDGDPVLMRFILDHDPGGLKLMQALGADLNILDRGGRPLITNVAMSQDWDMVWALIELGAAYDYENGVSTQPLSLALKLRYPSPDSPLYAYKAKVWQFLKNKGLPLPPLNH